MIHIPGVGRSGLLVIAIVALQLLMSSCAMKNTTIAEEKRVVLKEKTTAPETYKKGPLTVNYEYQQAGDTLTMSGSIGFPRSVDSLDVRIFFLSGDGLVLDRGLVYSSGFRSLAARDSTRTFRRTLDLPVGTVSFSFDETSKDRTSMR